MVQFIIIDTIYWYHLFTVTFLILNRNYLTHLIRINPLTIILSQLVIIFMCNPSYFFVNLAIKYSCTVCVRGLGEWP